MDYQKTLASWNIWSIKDRELLNLMVARKGGKTTTKIIDKILEWPKNKNQLAKELGMDYKTISYHIDIMKEHDYLLEEKCNKHYYYSPSDKLFNSIEEYNLIKEYIKE